MANNKDADQTVRMCKLICVFVVGKWHKSVGSYYTVSWHKIQFDNAAEFTYCLIFHDMKGTLSNDEFI